MFDFILGLDPKELAEFWKYCIGFLVIGLAIGWFVRVGLTRIASNNFRSEKERFETERATLTEIKEKYETLCKDLEKNDEYWLYKKQTSASSASPDADPSELLHSELKKR